MAGAIISLKSGKGHPEDVAMVDLGISVTRAAKRLGVSIETVRRLIRCGELQSRERADRGWYRITVESFNNFVLRRGLT